MTSSPYGPGRERCSKPNPKKSTVVISRPQGTPAILPRDPGHGRSTAKLSGTLKGLPRLPFDDRSKTPSTYPNGHLLWNWDEHDTPSQPRERARWTRAAHRVETVFLPGPLPTIPGGRFPTELLRKTRFVFASDDTSTAKWVPADTSVQSGAMPVEKTSRAREGMEVRSRLICASGCSRIASWLKSPMITVLAQFSPRRISHTPVTFLLPR